METKICSKCGRELPVIAFTKDKQKKDGLCSSCKECYRQYYEEHKKEISKRQKQYYEENKEEISKRQKQYFKQYYQENKEKISKYIKQWHKKNKDKIKEHQNNYYHENKEYILERTKIYYERNKDKILERNRVWDKNNRNTPMRVAHNRLASYNYSDKIMGRGKGDLTAKWIVENIFSQACVYCGESDWHKLGCNRLDNSKPHTKDNVEPCCTECNRKLPRK